MTRISAFLTADNIVLLAIMAFLIVAAILVYALWTKGDVLAEVSHGHTVFKLEAKERRSRKR
jgi:hypothetical protein